MLAFQSLIWMFSMINWTSSTNTWTWKRFEWEGEGWDKGSKRKVGERREGWWWLVSRVKRGVNSDKLFFTPPRTPQWISLRSKDLQVSSPHVDCLVCTSPGDTTNLGCCQHYPKVRTTQRCIQMVELTLSLFFNWVHDIISYDIVC